MLLRAAQSLLQEAGHKCATKCWDVMMAARTTSEADNELAAGESDVELLLTDVLVAWRGVGSSGRGVNWELILNIGIQENSQEIQLLSSVVWRAGACSLASTMLVTRQRRWREVFKAETLRGAQRMHQLRSRRLPTTLNISPDQAQVVKPVPTQPG